jgi:hypothetical protein
MIPEGEETGGIGIDGTLARDDLLACGQVLLTERYTLAIRPGALRASRF